MKKALLLGSSFARRLGDSESAEKFYNAMVKLNATLYSDHWNGIYVYEDVARTMVLYSSCLFVIFQFISDNLLSSRMGR